MKNKNIGNIQIVSSKETKQNFEQSAQLLTQIDTLSSQAVKLTSTIRELQDDIARKNIELTHLKDLLNKCIPQLSIEKIVTDEELIALRQLNFLKEKALIKELTLDELKAFDILVKNKRLCQDKSTDNVGTPLLKDVNTIKLLEIAQSPTKKDE